MSAGLVRNWMNAKTWFTLSGPIYVQTTVHNWVIRLGRSGLSLLMLGRPIVLEQSLCCHKRKTLAHRSFLQNKKVLIYYKDGVSEGQGKSFSTF